NFTGANVNVVTRSGTNQLTGSAYKYWNNETYIGTHIGNYKASWTNSQTDITGARVGGPIIKNKLFFFANIELERVTSPGSGATWKAKDSGVTGPTISNTPADSLVKFSNFLKDKYGYETGPYEGYLNNQRSNNDRYLFRFDYNLDAKNKFNVSFVSLFRVNDQPVSPSSSSPIGSVTNGRIGAYSMTFANSQYMFTNKVKSYSAEWLHTFNNHISNQLLVSYTSATDKRSTPGSPFPFIDIYDPVLGGQSGGNYMSAGQELFSTKNVVKYNTLNVYDNLTVDYKKHHITAGLAYQYLTVGNSFFPLGGMYYRYSSLQSFINNERPTAFGYSYAYDGKDDYVKASYGLASVYGQDKINLSRDLVITAGARLELPIYNTSLSPNPNADTFQLLLDANGNRTNYTADKWPNQRLLISPRVAFNWNPLGSKSVKVRGGTGIFVGQIPFVWFTNMPGSTGNQVAGVAYTAVPDG
ncbi:MAG: cell envelope biogenesis protein OmpA, partial [Chitinophagia bacterium]|nr:cell envelope biogenesis protein OmpA [Chitinophagia bacterium]